MDSLTGCLPGTRVSVLRKMLDWADAPTSTFSIYWLAGLAGTGKSTIAMSFCEHIAGQGKFLLLSFFASKSSAERRDPFRMLHTFVRQLADMDRIFCVEVLKRLRDSPSLLTLPVAEQVRLLLTEPLTARPSLTSAAADKPLILIIDALDECRTVSNVEGHGLVPHLATAFHGLPIKLVVTSRLEDHITQMFDRVSAAQTPFLLHNIDDTEVAADVNKILEKGFAHVSSRHSISAPWPSTEDMLALVELTGHLLIFASTVIRFVGDDRFSPQTRLRQIIDRGAIPKDEAPFAEVDALYENILLAASRDSQGHVVQALAGRLRRLVGTVILLQEPLDFATLALILDEVETTVRKDVRALSSVLMIGDESGSPQVVQLFHPSFRDYLLERCQVIEKGVQFSISSTEQHQFIAIRCLEMLNQYLREDMCDLGDPSQANSDILDLAQRLQDRVPHAVRYASTHWVAHLVAAIEVDLTLLSFEELCVFTRHHLLHWVELLSLQGQLSYAFQSLSQIVEWCQVRCFMDESEISADTWVAIHLLRGSRGRQVTK